MRRLATMLRALALYHGKSPVHLFMVRLAQGLCHAAKGTVTLCPAHADRRLTNQPALAGLLVVLTAFLDCKNSQYPAPATHSLCTRMRLDLFH